MIALRLDPRLRARVDPSDALQETLARHRFRSTPWYINLVRLRTEMQRPDRDLPLAHDVKCCPYLHHHGVYSELGDVSRSRVLVSLYLGCAIHM
jgi:hypothetical protein